MLLSSPWKKSSEVEQRDRHVCTRVEVTYGISFVLRAAKSCSSQSALTQNLTLSNYFMINCSFRCMKNYYLNPQTTYTQSGAYKDWGQKIITFSALKPIDIFRSVPWKDSLTSCPLVRPGEAALLRSTAEAVHGQPLDVAGGLDEVGVRNQVREAYSDTT